MAFTTIDDPTVYFQVKLYTGNGTAIGSGGNSITFDGDTDLAPGMLWLKRRDSTSSHNVHDEVRGAQNRLYPDTTDAQDTSVTESVNAFTSDGFNLGNSGGGNASGGTYVAWCWKAGGSASSQTDGDIDTSRSVNTTSGFSIATYTGNATNGATRGHGLGVVPHMIVVKNTTDSVKWYVYHHKNTAAPETDYLELNAANATADQAGWNDTAPTSTLVTTSDGSEVNASGKGYVMFSWVGKQGFSSFGSFIGNGNADGPFVYLGFKPAMVIVKDNGAAVGWGMYDYKRNGYNADNKTLYAQSNSGEDAGGYVDLLSNGFKITSSSAWQNRSGGTFIYMAFAEAPFVNSNGVPCNAR